MFTKFFCPIAFQAILTFCLCLFSSMKLHKINKFSIFTIFCFKSVTPSMFANLGGGSNAMPHSRLIGGGARVSWRVTQLHSESQGVRVGCQSLTPADLGVVAAFSLARWTSDSRHSSGEPCLSVAGSSSLSMLRLSSCSFSDEASFSLWKQEGVSLVLPGKVAPGCVLPVVGRAGMSFLSFYLAAPGYEMRRHSLLFIPSRQGGWCRMANKHWVRRNHSGQ